MAKAVYGGLIQTILGAVGPRNPELVGAVSLWRTGWKAMPDVLLFTGIRSWCTQMGAPTTSEGSSCYLKRTNGRGRAATTHGLRRTKTSLLGVSRQVSTREPHSADERQIVLSRVYLHHLPPMIRHRALLIAIIQASNAVRASVGSAASEGRTNGTRASGLV